MSFASTQYFYPAPDKVGGTISPESVLLLCPSESEIQLQSPIPLELVAKVFEGDSWKSSLKHIIFLLFTGKACKNGVKWDCHSVNFLLRNVA